MKTPREDHLNTEGESVKQKQPTTKSVNKSKAGKRKPTDASSSPLPSPSSVNPVRSELDSAKADLKPAVNNFLRSLKSGVKSSVGAAVKAGKSDSRRTERDQFGQRSELRLPRFGEPPVKTKLQEILQNRLK